MSQVVIDTDKIWSEIRVPLAIIVVIAIVIIAGITLYDKGWTDATTAQTAASAPVATVIAQPTAIPAPAPAGFQDFWTGPQEIQSMTTGSGNSQINTWTQGGYYFVPWQAYSALEPGDWISLHVTGTTSPYGTVIMNADQVVLTGYGYPAGYHVYDSVMNDNWHKTYPGFVTVHN